MKNGLMSDPSIGRSNEKNTSSAMVRLFSTFLFLSIVSTATTGTVSAAMVVSTETQRLNYIIVTRGSNVTVT